MYLELGFWLYPMIGVDPLYNHILYSICTFLAICVANKEPGFVKRSP